MKAVLQVVTHATVRVDGGITGQIGPGLLVFLGVAEEDEQADLDKIVKKVTELRIFKDDAGKTNLSLQDVNGELLIVSQFTLLADCKKGRRPSYTESADPKTAENLYNLFLDELLKYEVSFKTGIFREHMNVALENDGPVTLIIDSKN